MSVRCGGWRRVNPPPSPLVFPVRTTYRNLVRLGSTLLLLVCGSALLADEGGDAFFESRIRPVLVERCIECHGAKKQKGGLRLDSREEWMKGGESGAAIVPGDLETSVLIQAVRYTDADLKMPPEKKGGQLSAQEVADFEAWVKAGAPAPRNVADAPERRPITDPKTFWSYQPVQAITPPAVPDTDWVRTPVDAFILAKLGEQGLAHAPPADARTLVRRAYFDLLGLPPTPEEVDEFVRNPSADAWARLIDRLLESPQIGRAHV